MIDDTYYKITKNPINFLDGKQNNKKSLYNDE